MSFFGFGSRPPPTSAEKLAMAELEMDIMGHMMNKYIKFFPAPAGLLAFYLKLTNSFRLADTCFKKCVNSDYKETELNKGESVCLDRCVNKFVEAFQKVAFFPLLP